MGSDEAVTHSRGVFSYHPSFDEPCWCVIDVKGMKRKEQEEEQVKEGARQCRRIETGGLTILPQYQFQTKKRSCHR